MDYGSKEMSKIQVLFVQCSKAALVTSYLDLPHSFLCLFSPVAPESAIPHLSTRCHLWVFLSLKIVSPSYMLGLFYPRMAKSSCLSSHSEQIFFWSKHLAKSPTQPWRYLSLRSRSFVRYDGMENIVIKTSAWIITIKNLKTSYFRQALILTTLLIYGVKLINIYPSRVIYMTCLTSGTITSFKLEQCCLFFQHGDWNGLCSFQTWRRHIRFLAPLVFCLSCLFLPLITHSAEILL